MFTFQLEDIHRRISESYDEMIGVKQQESNLKGQRATRASENFGWNLRLLKAQMEIMGKIHQECKDHIKQVQLYRFINFQFYFMTKS